MKSEQLEIERPRREIVKLKSRTGARAVEAQGQADVRGGRAESSEGRLTFSSPL